jgi:dihydroflavonol-4-reductase
MAPIPRQGVVAVTGAAGYIGGWVVRGLLERGYRVRACVRNVDDAARTDFLKAMPGFASGRLTLHAADLDQAGCFDEVFKGCHGVAHVSHVSGYDNQDYIRGVCDHVIASVNASGSVTRVVLTSSIAAIISEVDIHEVGRRPVFYEDRYPDEANPRRTPDRGQGYSMGKLVAERAFAAAAEASGQWDVVTCCPGDNVGPIQSPHQQKGAWQHNIETMLTGKYYQNGAYRPWMTVDVRDCADVHIRLLESLEAKNGERIIAWSADKRNVEDIAADIARLLPELNLAPPELVDPFPDRVKAREAELRGIWALAELRNDRAREKLGVTFRTLDASIRDCVESLLAIAKVEPNLRTAPGADAEVTEMVG